METCSECQGDIDPDVDEFTCENERWVCGACEPKPNENCLEGMRCPTCGSREPFRIRVTLMVLMYDEGSEDRTMGGDTEWGPESYCECYACGQYGLVKAFQEETAP